MNTLAFALSLICLSALALSAPVSKKNLALDYGGKNVNMPFLPMTARAHVELGAVFVSKLPFKGWSQGQTALVTVAGNTSYAVNFRCPRGRLVKACSPHPTPCGNHAVPIGAIVIAKDTCKAYWLGNGSCNVPGFRVSMRC